jgi:pimeloyl-ACP methyl ester carboxylesterase
VAVTRNGIIEIFFETFGDDADPAMLLINGLGSQCISYEDEFCDRIAAFGYFVIRFDNRDVGLSSRWDEAQGANLEAAGGVSGDAPYSLSDMANDAVAVLDALGIERAHVMGLSMGGMIVQAMAIDHPERFITLTSVMSTTGDVDVGQASEEALKVLLSPMPTDREGAIALQLAGARTWGSPDAYDVTRITEHTNRALDRSPKTAGVGRQMKAILTSGSRSEGLSTSQIPTLVLHGSNDTLVNHSGGVRTAEVIPGARLVTIEGMGHDLAPNYWDRVIALLTEHASRHR